MTVLSKVLQIRSKGEDDIIDLTKHTAKVVLESKLTDGIVTVFVVGSTAAITTIEFERGLAKDFPEMLSRVAPKEIYYEHERMWQDGNGHSHVRASLIGPSLTVPFKDGGLILGTWQQIVLVEMDTRYRERKVSDYRGIIRDSYQFFVFEFSSNNCHVLDSRAAVLPYVVSSTPENFRRKIVESIHFTICHVIIQTYH